MKILEDRLYKYLSLVSFEKSVEDKLETNQLSVVMESSHAHAIYFCCDFVVTK
jgi:hypothetical protein